VDAGLQAEVSWAVGFDSRWNRDIGYGVPAMCDFPRCTETIDRGLAHVCGGEAYGGEHGCGLYFCEDHLWWSVKGRMPQRCSRCVNYRPPFTPKPDLQEWTDWKMTDPSWAEWRKKEGIADAIPVPVLQ
jgi:hypothetical protein